MTTVVQTSLFGLGEPTFDPLRRAASRVELAGGAWFELVPSWLGGDQALLDRLVDSVDWQAVRRPMYDRVVDVPRLTASLPRHGPVPGVLDGAARWLRRTYGEPFTKISLAWYRDGADSVAPHGDQVARDLDTSIMATLSLGGPRRFTLSPNQRGDAPVSLELGGGDLFVMGGTIQRTWRHGVPKTSRPVGPRIVVMFRPPWLG